MRGLQLGLGAVLAVSLILNAMLYRRTLDLESRNDARPRARDLSAAPAAEIKPSPSGGADSSQLLSEIRQLRGELAAVRATPVAERASSNAERAPSRKAAEELSPAIAQDPVLVNALAERDAIRHSLQKYWRDVERVSEVKDAIGLPKYREVVARLTADFLGLDSSTATAFVTASTQAAQDLDRAEAERKDAVAKIKATTPDRDTRKRLEDGVDARYVEERQAAIARLDPFVRGTPLQQDLRGKSGGHLMDYLRGR